jgi:hypothetical protein
MILCRENREINDRPSVQVGADVNIPYEHGFD